MTRKQHKASKQYWSAKTQPHTPHPYRRVPIPLNLLCHILPTLPGRCRVQEREHSKSLMKTPSHRPLPSTPLPLTPSRPTPLIEPGHIYRLLWPSVRLIYAFDSLCLFERKLNRRQRLAAQTPLLRRTAAGDADSTRTISGQETVASSSSSTLAPLRADHVLLRTS